MPQAIGTNVFVDYFMHQAIGTTVFVNYFMPQAIDTTVFVDYFMPQAIGTTTFVDYFMPQAIGTTIFVDYFLTQAIERVPPKKPKKREGYQNEVWSNFEDKLFEKMAMIWTPAKTLKRLPQTNQEEEATKWNPQNAQKIPGSPK